MITVEVPTIEGIKKEITYNINDFPYRQFLYNKTVSKKGIQYYNISSAFDIETTTVDGIKDSTGKYISNPFGFMYQWQFCICDTVCFGRTFEELTTFFDRLAEYLQLNSKKKLVIYVHNLSYEFQFIKDFLNIESMFAKDKRKVLKFSTSCFEFRCSYFLSNMNLIKFCENSELCIHYKMADTYDYTKLRTPKTPLTNEELAYCYNDVRGLCECIDTLLLEDNILTIPLTNTGYVRREFRKKMRTEKNQRLFKKTALNEQEYLMLRRAFRGGNTHANRRYAGKKIKNVHSYDIQSSYPAVMSIEEYPVGKFTAVTLDTQQKLEEYCIKYCVVMDIEFYDIELIDNISIPYIDIAHCRKHSKIVNDNGRILKADYIEMTLTNIDLDIIIDTYTFSGLYIQNAMYSIKGKLPLEFRQTLMEFYTAKTELKGVNGKEYEYMKSKNRVNSGYGMTVTAIDHSEIEYNNHEWFEIQPDTATALEKYYNGKNNFLSYQWGVFVTAHARKHLQDLLNKVNDYVVYTDTDSIKFIGEKNKKYFEQVNAELIKIAKNNDIPALAYDKKGVARYLGVWDYEGCYDEFKTLGAKKYCYNKGGEFHITVSGMSKKKGAKAVGGIDNFIIGKTFNDVGRTVSWYNESEIQQITVNNDTFTTASNIGILETSYTLGITNEYHEILEKYVDIYKNLYYN
jgi:hypothetical protein